MENGKKYKLTDKCITPNGRNMTRDEDAIIEAKKYYRNDIKCYDAFLHGVEWVEEQIANVWHDVNIVPSENKGIIYLTKNNKLGVFNSIKSNNWDWYVSGKYSIIKWAYSTDLLPKQFRTSE